MHLFENPRYFQWFCNNSQANPMADSTALAPP
jgi:hypothetical protein